jgi:hypothetical protein
MLDNTGYDVDVTDVVISDRVPNEDAVKVMVVQFSSAFSGLLDADMQAEHPEVLEVWLLLKPALKLGHYCSMMNSPVVEISHVK